MMPLVQRLQATILVVDDEQMSRELIARLLRDSGFEVHAVASASDAYTALASGRIQLMLCDVMMPDESGPEFLARLRSENPDLPVIMVSGISNTKIAQVALDYGAYSYITKPFSADQLRIAVSGAMHRRDLERQNRLLQQRLDATSAERERNLRNALNEMTASRSRLQRSGDTAIVALACAIEGRAIGPGDHVVRVSAYARLLVEAFRPLDESCEFIVAGIVLHDVGKVAVPTEILLKPGPLTIDEYAIVKEHAELGYRILSSSDEPLLIVAASIARTHHERWDGTGYPYGLAGREIPIEGRIAAAANTFDALVSPAAYRPPVDVDDALGVMREGRGTQFDPEVVDAFLERADDVVRICQSDRSARGAATGGGGGSGGGFVAGRRRAESVVDGGPR